MAKNFAPRVSKKDRDKLDITAHLDQRIFQMKDEMLLKGAQLANVALDKIIIRKQVRTKFNDESIRELAENIKENGLIQPLVLHREGNIFVLICGERRFRAMSTIDMKDAPCFILEDKSNEELMAIQFSENSSREQLHYIDQADSIFGYKKLTGASERKIQGALGISKSEVHRCLLIAKLPKDLKEAAKEYNIEKYVLLEWMGISEKKAKDEIKKAILSGAISKRVQLKKVMDHGLDAYLASAITLDAAKVKKGAKAVTKAKVVKKTTKKVAAKAVKNNKTDPTSVIDLIKAKDPKIKLDKKTQKLLENILLDN